MKITKTVCDVCHAENAEPIAIFVGREPDPAGASENRYETVDLCFAHTRDALQHIGRNLIKDQGTALHREILSWRKP